MDIANEGCAAATFKNSGWTIENGRLLTDDGIAHSRISFSGGMIDDLNDGGTASSQPTTRRFDAAGYLVLPGIVDIHGDAFERIIMPRPTVAFDMSIALHEADRQLTANGITTAYHGLTVSWEPGLRSLEQARKFVEVLRALRSEFRCQTFLHVRWETFAFEAIDEISGWLRDEPNPILAFNDHTTSSAEQEMEPRKIMRITERTGLDGEAFRSLLSDIWSRREQVPGNIEKMAAGAKAAGATLLAHDENSPEQRRWFRQLGARTCEFPLTVETAEEARRHGEHVVLGAPNVLRGGSHIGAPTASRAIADGLCTVLATDYYYPAPMQAAFNLVRNDICDLPAAWALVSKNPAEAAGLTDRGFLSPGKRADIIVVDDSQPAAPRLAAVFVGGEMISADMSTAIAIGS